MDQDPTQLPPADGAPTRPDMTGPDQTAGGAEGVPTPPSRSRRWIPITVAAVAAALVAVGAGAFLVLRGSDEVLFDQVPATADVVVAAYLDPAASQKVNLFRMAERFPDLGGRDEVMADVDDALDEALAEVGLTHEDLGWVGVEIALWADVRSGDDARGAVLIDGDDEAGARATLDRVLESLRDEGDDVTSTTYQGVEIWSLEAGGSLAYADDTMILASEAGAVEATIDAGAGRVESIETSQVFADAVGDLPDARLMVTYVGYAGIADALEETLQTAGAAGTPLDFGGAQSVAMSVSATDTGIALDVSQVNDPAQMLPELVEVLDQPPHDNAALRMTPGEAFGVFAVEHVDVLLERGLDALEEQEPSVGADLEELGITGSDGLLENLTGDLAMEAAPGGDDPVAGAVMLGVEDAARMELLIDDTFTELSGAAPAWVERDHRGVTLRTLDDDAVPLTYAIVDGMFVLGSSPEHVARIVDVSQDGDGLDQDEGFAETTADLETADALMFMDVPAILQAVRDQLPPEEAASFEDEVGGNLDPIGHVVMGVNGDASRQHVRLFVEIT